MTSQYRLPVLLGLLLLILPFSAAASLHSDQALTPPPTGEAGRHYEAGIAKSISRDFDGAIAEFSEAIQLDPTFGAAFRERALAEWRKEDLDGALRDYSQATVLDPADDAALYGRGLVYARQRHFDRAIEDYSRVVAINPRHVNAYDDRGLAKTEQGDIDGGISDLNTAIMLNPRSARAYNNRGYAKAKKKDYAAAIADYDQAIKLDPNYVIAYGGRADVKVSLKDPIGAIADYTKSLTLDPKRAGAFFGRGRMRLDQGDRTGAIADFTQAISLNPKYVSAFTFRCQAHWQNSEFDEAIADCTQAITLNPKTASAFLQRGQARLQKGDLDAAAQDLTEAINLNPQHSTASYERCNVEVRQGALDQAIRDCNDAIALDPSLAVAYFARGVARAKRGEADEAHSDYVRAHELDSKLEVPRTFVAGIGTGAGSAPGGAVNGVYRSGGGITLPKTRHEVRPQYTADALQAHVQGTVLLECVVRVDGTVGDLRILRSLDPVYGLDSESLKAAKQWTFEPGTKDGKPVPVLITLELAFRIGDAPAVAAPFALPTAFGTAPPDSSSIGDDPWRDQMFDQSTLRTRVQYPKGWTTITGLADDVIVLQNTREPFGVMLFKPQPVSALIEQGVTQSALQGFADGFGKIIGRSTTAFGQVRSKGRLWFWLNFDQALPAINDKASSGQFAYTRGLVDATRTWFFFTTVGGQQYAVMFFVARMSNSSVAELNRVTELAGPVFAKILERITFESP